METIKDNEVVFACDLIKLQSGLEHVKRDTQAHRYKYAQLDQCWDTIKNPLIKNNFCFIQLPYNNEEKIGIHSILLHKSGQRLESKIAMNPIKPDPQAVGSLLTYLRRYSLMAIIGLCPVDDDAQGAMPSGGGAVASHKKATPTSEKERFELAINAIEDCKDSKALAAIDNRIQISEFSEEFSKDLNIAIEKKLNSIMTNMVSE
jgi:hypothetical protein